MVSPFTAEGNAEGRFAFPQLPPEPMELSVYDEFTQRQSDQLIKDLTPLRTGTVRLNPGEVKTIELDLDGFPPAGIIASSQDE